MHDSDSAHRAQLARIFADLFGRNDLVLADDLGSEQLEGWDSMKQIEIVLACESAWSIRFSTRELDSLRTVGDLLRVIAARTAGADR